MNYKHKVSSASLLQDKFDIWAALWITTRTAMAREFKLPIKKINKKYSKSLLHGLLKTLLHQKQMLLSAAAETVPSSKEAWNPPLSQGLSIEFPIPFVYRLFVWCDLVIWISRNSPSDVHFCHFLLFSRYLCSAV